MHPGPQSPAPQHAPLLSSLALLRLLLPPFLLLPLLLHGRGADPSAARDEMLHTMACKASIKGGWQSDEAELRVLLAKVQSGEVQFCPHGRPVKVKLSKYEIEKLFKRA